MHPAGIGRSMYVRVQLPVALTAPLETHLL